MQPNIKRIKLWIKALRSGKYKQGEGALKSDDGKFFCCLGVATDLCIKSLKQKGFNWAHISDWYTTNQGAGLVGC